MLDIETALRPYNSNAMKQADEVMSLEYTNGKWDELNKTIYVFELMTKDTSLEHDKRLTKFYWAMRDRRDELHELMEKKRKNQ